MSVIILVLVLFSRAESARILGIVSMPSYSHQEVFQPLWNELSLHGHQVTVLTTHPQNNSILTNLTEIHLKKASDMWYSTDLNNMFANMSISKMFEMKDFLNDILTAELEHPQVQDLIHNKDNTFDVVLAEGAFPPMFYFAERFRCPLIIIMSLEAPSSTYRLLGNPTSPAVYPDFMLPFYGRLNFFQRAASLLKEVAMESLGRWTFLPPTERMVKKYFGDNQPSLDDLVKKTSMLFTNTDSVLHKVRPLLPNVVQIGGGTHLRKSKPLPETIRQQLDGCGKHGFIYFSLGSNAKSALINPQTLANILEVFSRLPQLILWKFELDDLPNKPTNVITSKWFPQQDILRHPNIRLFITQGGLQSVEEAIHSHVPMLGLPHFGDQHRNVGEMVIKGIALELDINKLNSQDFENAINEIIQNRKYREAVNRLATLAVDNPMTGLEKAVWWTEYVIRHKGAEHLRSPALELPWYQYFLLDVIGFCLTVVLVVLYVTKRVVCLMVKTVKRLVTRSVNKEKKN